MCIRDRAISGTDAVQKTASIPYGRSLADVEPSRNLSQYLIKDGAAAAVAAGDVQDLYLPTFHITEATAPFFQRKISKSLRDHPGKRSGRIATGAGV